jgi:two-component system, cell cycle response regulator
MSISEKIRSNFNMFPNLCDYIRVIDPMNKVVIESDYPGIDKVKNCFKVWNRNSICEDCISLKAYRERETFVKIEKLNDKTIMVTSTQAIVDGEEYIIEILKDVTKSDRVNYSSDGCCYTLEGYMHEINDKAMKDGLTGVYNRRFINERLQADINNTIIRNKPLSVIMADLDHFKRVNDEYGHVIGDKVLQEFSRIMMDNIRKDTDWVGRYGGEEFLVVLNNADSEVAFKTAEKIRRALENHEFSFDGVSFKITASFGVYGISNLKLDMEKLISTVDNNLYLAKNSGRNRTIK